jgi:hypothetical protein
MSDLLTFDNNIISVILKNIDKESLLILGLVSKELYKTVKTLYPNEKLIGSLKYLTSTLSLLKYGHKNGCPLNNITIKYILDVTNKEPLECLKYLHENGCPWHENTCHEAAINGHLECLKYLHENGCHWDKETCEVAAWNGQLECLKYLHENGCPWDALTYLKAVWNIQFECSKYARDNGCPDE